MAFREYLHDLTRNVPQQNWSAELYNNLVGIRGFSQNLQPQSADLLQTIHFDTALSYGFDLSRPGNYSPVEVKFSEIPEKDKETKDLMSSLYDSCSKYMTYKELEKIDIAMALMHYGHWGQKRADGQTPYANHLLHVALPLAGKDLQCDWETISAALCHDLLEDSTVNGYPVTRYYLSKMLSKDVARTVESLSKVRFGKGDRPEEVDDVTRAVLFESLEKNPRASLIKIYDRLHNMKTIGQMLPAKQKEKATETLRYYVPLARFLGLFEEARALATLSLKVIDPVYSQKLESILDTFTREIKEMEIEDRIRKQLAEILNLPEDKIQIIIPDIYTLYQRVHKKEDLSAEDCFLSVDIEMKGAKMDQKNFEKYAWVKKAWQHRITLALSGQFDSIGSLDLPEVKRKMAEKTLQSMEFHLQALPEEETSPSLILKINIYPPGRGKLMQIPITHLYYKQLKAILPEEIHSPDNELNTRHKLGQQKWEMIRKRVTQVTGLAGGDLGRKFLDFILPGKLELYFLDGDKKIPWWIEAGSTVLDLACDRFPYQTEEENVPLWQGSLFFIVNDNAVGPDYVLSVGDTVSLVFESGPSIQPYWIRCLKTSGDEFKEQIRRHFRDILAGPKKSETQKKTRESLIFEAKRILESLMDQKPIVDLRQVFDVVDPDELLFQIALDELDAEKVSQYAEKLLTYQLENVVSLDFKFTNNEQGIESTITDLLSEKYNIDIRYSEGMAGVTPGDSPIIHIAFDISQVKGFTAEVDYVAVRVLVKNIHQELMEKFSKKLVSTTFNFRPHENNLTGIFRKKKVIFEYSP